MSNFVITPHLAGISDWYVGYAVNVLGHDLRGYLPGDQENMVNERW